MAQEAYIFAIEAREVAYKDFISKARYTRSEEAQLAKQLQKEIVIEDLIKIKDAVGLIKEDKSNQVDGENNNFKLAKSEQVAQQPTGKTTVAPGQCLAVEWFYINQLPIEGFVQEGQSNEPGQLIGEVLEQPD